jgi:Leucine-rich repeat (LRR) protein
MAYAKLTLKELKSICKDNHLKNYSALNKTELIAFIKKNKKNKQNKKKVGGLNGVLNRDTLKELLGNISEEKLLQKTIINLYDNQINTIEAGIFDGLTNLERLYLIKNQITTIKPGAFNGLINLQLLYLQFNKITTIKTNTFNELTILEGLNLVDNQITTIEAGAFNGLTRLEDLNLSGNQIKTIQTGTFDELTNLKGLNLVDNQITTIEAGAFNGLTRLEELVLYSNRINTIQTGAFNRLTDLQELNLYDNQITTIQSGSFDGLTKLQKLVLDYNEITTIQTGTFNRLTNLIELDLNSSEINTIEPGAFNGLTNLQELCLNNNQITTIKTGAFNDLTSLKNLELSNNQITTISSGIFNGLTSLIKLDLSNNQITTIEPGTFNGITLKLDGNFIDLNSLTNINNENDIRNKKQYINNVDNFFNTKKLLNYNIFNTKKLKILLFKILLNNNKKYDIKNSDKLLLSFCSKLKDEYNDENFSLYLFIFRCLYKLIFIDFKKHIKLPINPKKMNEKIKLLYVWMKIMNDKELNKLKYNKVRIINMLQNEFILRIDDKIIKPNTKNVNNTNINNTKYSVEYQNKNHVRFNMTNKNNGNIISKNKLLQANFFLNDLLLTNTISNTSTSINGFVDVGQKRSVLGIRNGNENIVKSSKLRRTGSSSEGIIDGVDNKKLGNINSKNKTYLDIPDFNKILPYLQNINNDLPDNNKDLFYLFGISHFIDFTKLTNKIFDKIIDNIDDNNFYKNNRD